jgi:hypothetical protein
VKKNDAPMLAGSFSDRKYGIDAGEFACEVEKRATRCRQGTTSLRSSFV